jgi:hypothetical protein
MKTKILSIVVAAALIGGCNSQQAVSDMITGTYAREYSFDQVNMDTDKSIGKASVRDTIFITSDGDNFQVSNSMWRKNNYDDKGWYKLGTNERGAFHTYAAKWNEASHTLNPVDFGVMNPIKVDAEKGKIFLGKTEYGKVR